MTELAAIEIFKSGIVTSVSIPDSSFWQILFPVVGENIFSKWDNKTNNQIIEFTRQIFDSLLPVKLSISINNHDFQCTAFRNSEEKATICWETSLDVSKVGYENVVKDRMDLVNLSFKNANTAIHFVKENGSFFDFNDALNNMLGYSREEFFQLDIFDIIPNSTPETWKIVWRGLKERGSKTVFSQQKKKDGSLIDIELKSSLIYFDGIELNCAFINDITERKKLENKLLMFDYSFKKISAPIIFFRKDGSIFDCNEAYCKLFGYDEHEILNLSLFDFGAGFTLQTFEQYWDNVKTLGNFSFKSHRTRKDGTIIDVEIVPNYIKFGDTELICSFVKDITEQLKLEHSLVEEKSMLRTLIDNLPFPVYVKDAEAKKLIVNKPYQDFIRKLNLNTDVIGKDDLDIFKGISNQIGYNLDMRVLKTGKSVIEENETYYFQNNDKRDLLTTKLPLIDGFGNIYGLVGFSVDITEKKKLDESLKLVDFAFRRAAVPMHIIQRDGKVYDCNLAACYALGYTEEEYKSLSILEINRGISLETFTTLWDRIAVNTEMAFNYRLWKKNNKYVDVEIRSNKIIYGDIELLCSSFIDITEKKKLEESLKLVDFAFRSASVPMHFIKEDGQVFDCNHAACHLLGYTEEEYKSLTIFDINPLSAPAIFPKIWESLNTESDKVIYLCILKKNGETLDVEVRTNKIKYGELELMCSSFVDITDKKRTEERLKMVDYAFRNASISMQFLRKDGSLYDFNNRAFEILGYNKEEYQTISLFDFTLRHTPESWKIRWEELKNGNNETFVAKIKRKDNSMIDVEMRTIIINYENEELAFACTIDITDKKRTEERLKIVDYAFRNASIPMHFLRQDGSIYDFNVNTPKLLGYTEEEFPSLMLFDFSSRHSTKSWSSRWEEFKRTKSQTNITKLRRKDNSLVDVEIRTDIVQYEHEELAFVSIIDISEKVKAEAELKKSNERYENAMIATSDVVWESDLEQNTTYFSSNFTIVFGHAINGLEYGSDNNWRRNLHPDDQQRVLESEGNVEKGFNDKWEIEYRLRKSDGSYAIVIDRGFSVKDENGKVLRLIGAMQDITKKKEEESRLKLLESVVVHTNDAIVITNARPINIPGPTIVYVNEAYTKITGYSLEESIGRSPRRLQNENTDRKELDKIKKALENWQPCEITIKNTRKNGEEFWTNIRVAPVANEKGVFTHWVSVQRDVTNEIEAQKEKESILNELINNNNELKQFGYITTHNLRAPLTNLVAISKLMDEEKIPDEFTRKLITGFKQSTFLLNDTLNDLIKILFIKERMNISTTDLKFENMLNKVKDFISNTIESKKVTIESDFSLAPTVKFSSIYLESIFLNLMTNAVKYAHPSRSPIIKISTKPIEDNKIKLVFSDNCLGMNMDRIKGRIFGLYQRFHNNADSKGLGLYLIHSQVTALGGTIEVESKVNVGTTFTIIFKN